MFLLTINGANQMLTKVKRGRLGYIVLIILSLTVISGCIFTEFKEPLPQVSPAKIVDCTGVWTQTKGENLAKLVLVPHKESGWLKEKPTGWYDFYFTNKDKPKKRQLHLTGFATKIGRESFLCFPLASMRKEDGTTVEPKKDMRSGKRGYLYAWYEVKGDKLRFDFFKSDKIKELIKDGKLGSKATPKGSEVDCRAKEVVALIKSHGVELFIGEERGRLFYRAKE